MGFAFVGSAYSRASPGFGQNLKSLVADGVTFTLLSVRGQADYAPIKTQAAAAQHVNEQTGGSKASNRNAVSTFSGAIGRATALHGAAATGACATGETSPTSQHIIHSTPRSCIVVDCSAAQTLSRPPVIPTDPRDHPVIGNSTNVVQATPRASRHC